MHGWAEECDCARKNHPGLTPDQIRHILEGARLLTVPIHRQGLVHEGLGHKIAHNAAVVECHSWAIGVEDAHHPDLKGWSLNSMNRDSGLEVSKTCTTSRRRD